MRMSRLFVRTLRTDPAELSLPGLALLVRAGFVLPGAGSFIYLPLGARLRHRILCHLGRAFEALGGQEVAWPAGGLAVGLAALAGERPAGRSGGATSAALAHHYQPDGLEAALAARERDLICAVARGVVASYRQMPVLLFGGGERLARPSPSGDNQLYTTETVLAGYSLHLDEAERETECRRVASHLAQAIASLGIDCRPVAGDRLRLGGNGYELVAPSTAGARQLAACPACGEWWLAELAPLAKPAPLSEPPAVLEPVHTPGAATIPALVAQLGITAAQTAKAVFLVAELHATDALVPGPEVLVFAVVRGDMALSQAKLASAVGALRLRAATAEEIRAIGAEPGYGSPVGVQSGQLLVVVDDLIPSSPNLVAGANRVDYHLRGVNYGRDFTAHLVADIALAEPGATCSRCGSAMKFTGGAALGHALAWPTQAALPTWPRANDHDGTARPLAIASYAVRLEALLVALADVHHDEAGLVWPPQLAPFQVHLLTIGAEKEAAVARQAEDLYQALEAAGIAVLYDDRAERAGVKLNDADLIGIPLRLTVGPRCLAQEVVEACCRADGRRFELPLAGAVAAVQDLLATTNGAGR